MKKLFLAAYLFLIFFLLFVQFILGPIINKVAQAHLRDSVIEYNRQLARGAFFMMEVDLLRLPESEWKNRISQLTEKFGYRIALLSFSELSLTTDQMAQLRQGKIAVVDDGELLFQRMGNSDMVLRKGPFSVLEPDSGYLTLSIWLTIIVILALLTFLCIIPYWRQLKTISNAATAFGNGQFHIRADIPNFSNLAPLALAFNTMAERIGQLINSHKELTNAVSHELRTPLSRLRFGLEMMEISEDREKRSLYVRELQTDVLELEDLVNELLTFARFDREKPELHFGMHHLEPFLYQVITESIADDRALRCHLHCRLDAASSHARFEPKYMARALGNLLQNAARYADSEICVVVERNGQECCLHIDDDGPGIAEADREKIFKPFTRLDVSRNRSSGGFGLGLAIVEKILKWHNGRVSASAAPSGGARLTVRWPGFAE